LLFFDLPMTHQPASNLTVIVVLLGVTLAASF